MSISYEHIAHDLLSSIDALIAALADDPVLHAALRRERARLQNHLFQQIDDADRPQAQPRRPLRQLGRSLRRRLRLSIGLLRGL